MQQEHGKSDSPHGPYTNELLSDDVAAFIEKLSVGLVHFCGLSVGGMVAQMVGVRHSEKIKTLLAIAYSAPHMPAMELWAAEDPDCQQGGLVEKEGLSV